MTTTQQAPTRDHPPAQISVARWVAGTQAVSLLGFAAVAVGYAVHAHNAPAVTTGWGDFREVVVYLGSLVALASTGAAVAVGLPACFLRRRHAMARIALIAGEYVAGTPVALALLGNLGARNQAPLMLLGATFVGLTATALIALHSTPVRSWTADPVR